MALYLRMERNIKVIQTFFGDKEEYAIIVQANAEKHENAEN